MIVYFDTSSLVKLYVEENGSADVERNLGEPVQFSSFDNRLIGAAKAEMQPR